MSERRYFLHYNELGSYDDLQYWFDTKKEALEKLERLKKDYNSTSYYAFIALLIHRERVPKND